MLILATKLKNRFPHADLVQLKNVSVNGEKRGCTGFIQANGKTVYVNTEVLGGGYLYRTAQHLKDYTGGQNRYARNLDGLVHGINSLLKPDQVDPVEFLREHFTIVHIR